LPPSATQRRVAVDGRVFVLDRAFDAELLAPPLRRTSAISDSRIRGDC
jgi:hypothetical protein